MYVVLVLPKNTHRSEAEVNDRYFQYRVDHEYVKETGDINDVFRGRVVMYADTIADAELIAIRMAGNYPGREIAVLSPNIIFSAIIAEVVRKEVSDKGVLPG